MKWNKDKDFSYCSALLYAVLKVSMIQDNNFRFFFYKTTLAITQKKTEIYLSIYL